MARKVLAPEDVVWIMDGSHYLFRAYHAITELSSPTGLPVNAIYGFLRMLFFLVEKHKMIHVLVAWDDKSPSWRKQKYEAYKAHRDEMPEDLAIQIPHLKTVLDDLGVLQYTCPGFEADDIMFTAANELSDFKQKVLVTNDKDLYQLVHSPDIIGFHPQLKVFIDEAFVEKRYGVTPDQMRDYLTLLGDTSDGVPGVPGVGAKTAAKLLTEHGTLQTVLDQLENIKLRPASRAYMENHVDDLWHSHELIGLVTVPEIFEKVKKSEFVVLNGWKDSLWDKLEELGFKALAQDLKRIRGISSSEKAVKKDSQKTQPVTLGRDEEGLLLYKGSDNPLRVIVGDVLAGDTSYLCYDFKKLLHEYPALLLLSQRIEDVMVVSYLFDPGNFEYDELLCNQPLSLEDRWQELMASTVYSVIEKPLTSVLFKMESKGICLDRDAILALKATWEGRLVETEKVIHEMAGDPFNVASPKQLAVILYEKCGLPIIKKKKTGPSTDAETLNQLRGLHPIIEPIQDYRELAKLVNTYTDALVDHIDEQGVVHTEFLQYGAASGRLSSKNPNIQNIPKRSEEGIQLRACFKPRAGQQFISFDYNQIELRILAHMSKAKVLVDTFEQNEDVHLRTALDLFGDEDGKTRRSLAKTINFGILYGQTAFGLSKVAGIEVSDAKAYIELYFKRYPEVKQFQDQVIEDLLKDGYVSTLFGRIRKFPREDLNRKNRTFNHILRAAFNTVLQGSGADLIKLAMLKTYDVVEQAGGALLAQIHDELIFELPEDKVEALIPVIRTEMEDVAKLAIPLVVNVTQGSF